MSWQLPHHDSNSETSTSSSSNNNSVPWWHDQCKWRWGNWPSYWNETWTNDWQHKDLYDAIETAVDNDAVCTYIHYCYSTVFCAVDRGCWLGHSFRATHPSLRRWTKWEGLSNICILLLCVINLTIDWTCHVWCGLLWYQLLCHAWYYSRYLIKAQNIAVLSNWGVLVMMLIVMKLRCHCHSLATSHCSGLTTDSVGLHVIMHELSFPSHVIVVECSGIWHVHE